MLSTLLTKTFHLLFLIKCFRFAGIEISDEEAEKIFTVRQAVELIQAKSD